MIAIAMYILLGVFVTLLLTLLIMPLIWRRAARLTKKRILAEMPLGYAELQAEKDMQSAQLAITNRKLEVIAETRLEQLANQTLKTDRLKQVIAKREDSISERNGQIAHLRDDLSAQQEANRQSEEHLANTRLELEQAQGVIADLETSKGYLEEEIQHVQTSLSEQKLETVAQLAQIESLKQEQHQLNSDLLTQTKQRQDSERSLEQKVSEIEHLKERVERQQEKIDAAQTDLADRDIEIAKLTSQLERASAQKPDEESDFTQRVAEAEAGRVGAEASLASLKLQLEHEAAKTARLESQLEAHAQQALPEEPSELHDVIDCLQRERLELQTNLAEATAQAQELRQRLSERDEADGTTNQAEQPVNGAHVANEATSGSSDATLSAGEQLLRDEIKTIATRITDLAGGLNGTESTETEIPTLRDPAPEVSLATATQNGSQANHEETGTAEAMPDPLAEFVTPDDVPSPKQGRKQPYDPWDQLFSLADKIRDQYNDAEKSSAKQ